MKISARQFGLYDPNTHTLVWRSTRIPANHALEIETNVPSYTKNIAVWVDIIAEEEYDSYMRLTRILTGEVLEERMTMNTPTEQAIFKATPTGVQYLNLYSFFGHDDYQGDMQAFRDFLPMGTKVYEAEGNLYYGLRLIARKVEG